MVNRLIVIFLLFSNICLAQSKIEYANFIQTDTAVKWAAIYNSYVNLTPVNPNFNLRNFYAGKLKQQGARAYLQDNASFSVSPVRLDYDQYKAGIKAVNYNATKMNWFFNYDEKYNASEKVFTQESNTCDTCILNNKISFFKVTQLLYYRKNQFKIQNILLSPVIYKKETGASKEATSYFETSSFAFNEIKNADAPVPPTAKFIGRSCNNLVLLPSDSISTSENNILTLNDWNLTRLLSADVKKKILKAYNTDNSIYPGQKNMLDYRKIDEYKAEPLIVPIYDSVGNIIRFEQMKREIIYDTIYNYTLIQDFYFDFDKEILYSKLVALAPRIKIFTSTGQFIGLTDYWGVIFPPEKKDIVKKKK
jgi:hypothetical protein